MHLQGRSVAVVLTFAVALTASVALLTRTGSASGAGNPQAVPRELVVGFDEHSSRAEQRAAVADAGGRISGRLSSRDGAIVSASDTSAVAERLSNSTEVKYVEPNYVVRASRVPNDDAFAEQWSLHNSGQAGGTVGADIGATSAWDVTTGAGTIVAVVDTGLDYNHPDLDGNVWHNPGESQNGADDDGNGIADDTHGLDFANGDSDPTDDAGHGTHVGGIIGAEGNNGFGTAGVDWNVQLMPLKFLDQNGEGNTADAADAIGYAVDHGARIINASWGGPAFSQALYEAVRQASDRGVLFVAASGNEGSNSDSAPDYPAAFDLPNVISVAATDRYDRLLPYSNYGQSTVDIAAPGDDIYSTVPNEVDPSGYASFSGTSMAAPAVTGTAALYLSRSPESSPDEVRSAILQSADPLSSLSGKVVTGGRLNAARAVGAHPSPAPQVDRTSPSAFRLLSPRNRYATTSRGVAFRWQRSTDASGIKAYKLYVDGRRVKTLTSGKAGGSGPQTKARLKLRPGKHRWYVKAYDSAGNKRRSSVSTGAARSSRSLYIGKRK